MSLSEDEVLERSPGIRVDILGPSGAQVRVGDSVVDTGTHALAVLDAFAAPISVAGAMAALKGRASGVQDWLDLISTVEAFRQEGVLVPPGSDIDAVRGIEPGAMLMHTMMLDDRERTSSFLEAISAVVQPGDVVVDLGTGTGVLAMAAARAGASRVYAIESAPIGASARALFAANGLADQITLVPGWSTRVELPELCDVLVSEMIGAQPLEERVLENTRDAWARMLKPGARIVPQGIEIHALPVAVPPEAMPAASVSEHATARWSDWYGLDFSPLVDTATGSPSYQLAEMAEVGSWPAPADPILLGAVDLRCPPELTVHLRATGTVTRACPVTGVAIFFTLDLGGGRTLTSDPRKRSDGHWANPVHPLSESVPLSPGDRFGITYAYGGMESKLDFERIATSDSEVG